MVRSLLPSSNNTHTLSHTYTHTHHTHVGLFTRDAAVTSVKDHSTPKVPELRPANCSLPEVISPAVADPDSSTPADTAPGPATADDPPTPTAAMLASARPVPSATAGYFRIHHVRFRTSGVEGGIERWCF